MITFDLNSPPVCWFCIDALLPYSGCFVYYSCVCVFGEFLTEINVFFIKFTILFVFCYNAIIIIMYSLTFCTADPSTLKTFIMYGWGEFFEEVIKMKCHNIICRVCVCVSLSVL